MGLFKRKEKQCNVVFVEENIILIGKEKYHHHDHELQEIKSLLKLILKKMQPQDDPDGKIKQQIFDGLVKLNEDIKKTV